MDNLRPVSTAINGKMLWLIAAGVLVLLLATVTGYFYLQKSQHPTRSQEPSGPFPYLAEEISFPNTTADITLSGTLTIPAGANKKFPAVILISGYGPQNRDAEWIGHKPFLILADHLTRLGMAVLRYDDRGFEKSTGDYHSSTSLDFATDVESAVQFLKSRKEIDIENIGLIGHSDGALVAPLVATRSTDIHFIVLLGAPGLPGGELLIKRQELIERRLGKPEHEIRKSKAYMETLTGIIVNSKDEKSLRAALQKFATETKGQIPDDQVPAGMTKDEFISRQVAMLTSPWFKYFLTYNPRATLEKVKCPVLALTGDKDVQAPATENLQTIESAIKSGGNADVTVKELQGLNHMFQACHTGMIDEYAKIEQSFSPTALDEISHWIVQHVKR